MTLSMICLKRGKKALCEHRIGDKNNRRKLEMTTLMDALTHTWNQSQLTTMMDINSL